MAERQERSPAGWAYAAVFAAGGALLAWAALHHAPTAAVLGDVQRIFYFHVPSAINAALAFVAAAVGGIGYLATRQERWDVLSRTATGTGVLFATIVLVTGPIWARSSWGAWWTWEPRLTTSLIAWLIFIGALLVRKVSHDPDQAARLGAVISIIGFLDLPLVYFSVRWWRGNHPVVFGQGGGGLGDPAMKTAFFAGMVAVTLMHLVLLGLSWRVALLAERVAAAERQLDEEGGLR